MRKKKTLFEEMMTKLQENIIPSLISDMKEIGMSYTHTNITPQHSLCFFSHLEIRFPFDVDTLLKINNVPVVVFNIKFDGQISICSNVVTGQNGLAILQNEIIIFDDFNKMFNKVRYENIFLFHLSKELTGRAKQFREEVTIIKTLLNEMDIIHPKITREVLFEKKEKVKK